MGPASAIQKDVHLNTAPGSSEDQLKLDPYRPIASTLQRSLQRFLPDDSSLRTQSSLPILMNLDASSYASRVSGKTLILDPHQASSSSSELVSGKKRNRGDPDAKGKARAEHESRAETMTDLGLDGFRKVKTRLGGGVKRGMKMDYNALLPLHYLHTLYLIQLFALLPVPRNLVPYTSTSTQGRSRQTPRLPEGMTNDGITTLLSKAEFTGMEMSIVSSRNSSLVGLKGIVVEETAMTFALVAPDSKVRIIPKEGTLFRVHFPAYAPESSGIVPPPPAQTESSIRRQNKINDQTAANLEAERLNDGTFHTLSQHLAICPRIQIDILGSSFLYRSAERAGRKFRPAQGRGGGSGWGENWVKAEWSEVLQAMEQASKGARQGTTETLVSNECEMDVASGEKGVGATGRKKRNKSRRKDPPAGGSHQVHF
ncbi:hypothetical protein BD324DRAFT_654010 [Kockovaella imperatae]|uniref:Uncharacterized protein n=1 Tax=Kockovaella imperatae TaxID=4999 RepID=A0A1Y1U6C0_9TREE|nr:hypothetical protein BD324DRAFT_654010 [Kockovaella imperatae]ORX33552.1 hypothetical protein BD324DRAFT_654010 [Kockovaella imperatae]